MKSLLGNWLLKSLDKGDLSRELTSTQGYSLELGLILLEHIEGQLNRSDTKAQFTLAANTIIVGVSIAFGEKGIASAIFDGNALFLTRLTGVLSTMLYFCLLHSTIFALTAVMPKFTFPTKSDNIFYFGAILGTSEPEFLEKMKNISAEELNDMVLSEIYALSAIAQIKFTKIKKSHRWLLLAIATWAIIQGLNMFTQ